MNTPHAEFAPVAYPLPSPFPEGWASGWGQDRFGLWQSFTVGGVTQRLRWIPPGEFLMGSPEVEEERESCGNDETQHRVMLRQGFWLADTACAQALWEAVMGKNPSRFKGAERPVEQVSWEDVVKRFLPALEKLVPGLDPVLPTEAQWEYACRAGTATPFWFGEGITTDQVNCNGPNHSGAKGQYRDEPSDVKALPANGWGLYQMHGNVWEWCADWLGAYPNEIAIDPVGPSEGRLRVLRGGCWDVEGKSCRSADRYGAPPSTYLDSFGFRLARGFSPKLAGQAGGVTMTWAAPAQPA
jgi:formylglycine-generating enzyme